VFIFKFVHLINEDATELETLLDFARTTVAPDVERRDGYFNRISITAAPLKEESLVPGETTARMRIFATFKPGMLYAYGGQDNIPGLLVQFGVVEVSTGTVVYTGGTVHNLPDDMIPGRNYEVGPFDAEWNGQTNAGDLVPVGSRFAFDVSISPVQLDVQTGEVVGTFDQSANLGEIGSALTDESCEHAFRHAELKATPVYDVDHSWIRGHGLFFVNTAYCVPDPGADRCDPVLHIIDPETGEEIASVDDCIFDMHRNFLSLFFPADILCCDAGGQCSEDMCPDLSSDAGRLNPCLVYEFDGPLPRFVVHAAGNSSRGSADLEYWKMTCMEYQGILCTRIKYERLVGPYPASVGGTKVCFDQGWHAGDEMDAIIPSPEKSAALTGTPPADGAGIYLFDEDDRISRSAIGNGMLDGARLSGLDGTDSSKVIVSSLGESAGGVSIYVNDVINEFLGGEGDGLGYELEGDICTENGDECLKPNDIDTDGDGIYDGFEVLGIRGAGIYPDQALPTWGANPLHKDVFVEADYSSRCRSDWSGCTSDSQCKSGQCIETQAEPPEHLCFCTDDNDCTTLPELGEDFRYAEECVDGFCKFCGHPIHPDAAVYAAGIAEKCEGGPDALNNPDGRPGYALHFDNRYASNNSLWGSWGGVDAGGVPTYDFGFGWRNYMSPIRQGIFHYALGIGADGSQGGVGRPYLKYEPTGRRGTAIGFTHELGHNFGLGHHGVSEAGSNYNYKPHYISIMNYMYAIEAGCAPNADAEEEYLRICDPDNLKFSHGERGSIVDAQGVEHDFALDPTAIDELIQWYNPYHVRHDFESFAGFFKTFQILPGIPPWFIDWDRNGHRRGIEKGRHSRRGRSLLHPPYR